MKHIFASAFLATTITAQLAWSETIAGTASVIDGDTLEIHGTRIRLSAIDAIESRQLCTRSDGRKWNCGKDAAFALANKIGRAPVSCDVSGTDRYHARSPCARCAVKTSMAGWSRTVGQLLTVDMAPTMCPLKIVPAQLAVVFGRATSSCRGIGDEERAETCVAMIGS